MLATDIYMLGGIAQYTFHSGIGAWRLLEPSHVDVLAVLSGGTAEEAHTQYCILDAMSQPRHGLILTTRIKTVCGRCFKFWASLQR